MRITALVKSRDHVCCRYRVAAYRAHLESRGHPLEIRPWSGGWFYQQLFPSFTYRFDTLLIQRRLLPAWQLRRLRRGVRHLIYDFDDSIFLHSSYHPDGQGCPRRFEQFRHMIQTADAVIAGNEFLREQAEAFAAPDKVFCIPTCVDVDRYALAQHAEDDLEVTLAWIGSASTLRGLERNRELLEQLGQRIPNLRLRVICNRALSLHHLPIDFRPWSEATETDDLAQSDIGISWLPDDAWSAGKCGLKVLQYMAAGLPVVANSVGVQKDLIRHGETGFLADSFQDWQDAIAWLARDPVLRRRMGAAGRARVEADFHVARGAERLEDLLRTMEPTAPRGASPVAK